MDFQVFASLKNRIGIIVCVLAALSLTCKTTLGADDIPANAKPGVKYIGSEKCIECHKDEHKSYLDTTHSVAAEITVAANEPDPASFQDNFAGHTYEVDIRNNEMLHRELLRGPDGLERHKTEHEIIFSIGSGAHGKSYLYRDGDFWAQSPISWFTETEKWGMSPGYDRPLHVSFRRKVERGCLFCHVGDIDRKEENPFVFDIRETTIGCERCHGPGELHAQRYRENPKATGPDNTIVNPANLSRDLSEAVCQQCHLQTAAKVEVTGKDEWDFRPGLPLADFRVDYQYRLGDDSMKIVGHVEQMHQSECYIQTESLSCITCHNPHQVAKPEQKLLHYRKICLDCHQDLDCGKPHQERVQLTNNSCYECHMPKADTNVVHAAFHHHRIGIHDKKAKADREVIAGLSPVLNIDHLSKQEQARCAALAKYEALRADAGRPEFSEYGFEAAAELIQLKQAGVDDPRLNAVLSWLAADQGQAEIADNLAEHVLKIEPRPTRDRIQATRYLANRAFKKGERQAAVELYRKLASYRRDAQDVYFLGLCENNAGNAEKSIEALKRSLEIDPSQDAAHRALQAIYGAIGKNQEAEYHARRAAENQALSDRLQAQAVEMMEREKSK